MIVYKCLGQCGSVFECEDEKDLKRAERDGWTVLAVARGLRCVSCQEAMSTIVGARESEDSLDKLTPDSIGALKPIKNSITPLRVKA